MRRAAVAVCAASGTLLIGACGTAPDTAPPSAPGRPVTTENTTARGIPVHWSPATDIGGGVARYRVEWDVNNRDEWTGTLTVTGTHAVLRGPQTDDLVDVRVRAVDHAGNAGPAATREMTALPISPDPCDKNPNLCDDSDFRMGGD